MQEAAAGKSSWSWEVFLSFEAFVGGETNLGLCHFLAEQPCGKLLVDGYIPDKEDIQVFHPQFEPPVDKIAS